jgi:hypothetical protein
MTSAPRRSTGPGTEFRALPDGLFACPAGHLLAPQDVDLDGPQVWAVDVSDVLGYVTDPAHALEQLGEALTDLGEADEMPDPWGTASCVLCGMPWTHSANTRRHFEPEPRRYPFGNWRGPRL